MKRFAFVLTLIACLGLSLARVEPAQGYTVAVDCDIFAGGTTYPDYNTKCDFSWTPGGYVFDWGGRWDAFLLRTDTYILQDEIHRPIFRLDLTASPESTWILCAVEGPYQITMNGYLMRETFGGTWGTGGWSQVGSASDIDTAVVFQPIPCS